MTDLVACLSTGKGTWGHVSRIRDDFERVYLITNDYGKENFQKDEKTELIPLNFNLGIKELRDEIENALKDKLKGDVAINIISGTGKEHMALISALLKLGVGIRLVALTKDGIEEI
ncbi:MAG: hypothetical protein V1663_02965 [archaeon]